MHHTAVADLALDCRNNLGESIIWDDRSDTLYWANIHEGEIWAWSPLGKTEAQVWTLGERVGAIGLREGEGLVVALAPGFAFFDLSTGMLDKQQDIEPGLPTTRLNDGRVDPAGRFVCGGMDEADPQQPITSVYTFSSNGDVTKTIAGITCANSICWSPDGATMYFTDMPSRRIDAFDYDPLTGATSNRRPFVDLSREPGLADGSVVDSDGYLWNAQWGGNKVVRYSPAGKVDREISLPITNPTCLCFGGKDLDTLFVTSAWFGLDEATRLNQPNAGSLFALKPGVTGQREYRFDDSGIR